MNDNIDLTKILKGCPKGTEFYCPLFGKVLFNKICSDVIYPIITNRAPFTSDGRYLCDFNGECMLFPAKDQRNWAKFERFWDKPKIDKFDVNTLQPFDKILVREDNKQLWVCDFFSHIDNEDSDEFIVSLCSSYDFCIPYNEETKHLLNTREDCPEYYKWWVK